MKTLTVKTPGGAYDILFERGLLARAGECLNLNRKTLVVTDDGVPERYAKTLAAQCEYAVTETVPAGEESKSLPVYARLLETMLEHGFTRKDCVVAVGGGVVGDLAGFTAASYMRGVDFYNIPTTVLSQVDSSIGGKTAVNFCGVKNIVGAFYQPKRVLIDFDLLSTLPPRQIANGLAEALKMSVTCDPDLFRLFEETERPAEYMEKIVFRSLEIKKSVVEQDEKEAGLRKILNFGHTLGHGLESEENLHGLYHGECVALGMLPMCGEALRPRVAAALTKLGLPTRLRFDKEKALSAVAHDKKSEDGGISVVLVHAPGQWRMEKKTLPELRAMLELILEKEPEETERKE